MADIKQVQDTTAWDLGTLLDDGDDAMVTLVAGETRLVVHRAVLAALSPVFEAMFRHDTLEARSGHVSITDIEGPVLRQLLAYCYTLRAPKLPSMAAQLLAAADKYGVSSLKTLCEQQLAAQLAVESAAATAVLAVRHCCPRLKEAAVAFVKANPQVMATQGWADAVHTHPEDMVEMNRLLAEIPAKRRVSATGEGGPSCGSTPQPNSAGHKRPRTMAATPPVDCHTAPPDEATVSRFRSLSADKRDERLIQAAQQGAVGELRALLAAGAHVWARDRGWNAALHCAAHGGHEEVARCLLGAGAAVDSRDGLHRTPLHRAADNGHAAVARLLLAAGANPNARQYWWWTPLHLEAMYGHAEAAAALLDAGADRGARDGAGRTPLDLARRNNEQQLVHMLTTS